MLGLSDEQTGRHSLSDLHIAVLEAVAQRRRAGGLQTDLAKHFGLAASNFFYVTKARKFSLQLMVAATRSELA